MYVRAWSQSDGPYSDALSTTVIVCREGPHPRQSTEHHACRVSVDLDHLDQPVPLADGAELYLNVVTTNDDGSTYAKASGVRRYAQNAARFEKRGKEQLVTKVLEIELTLFYPISLSVQLLHPRTPCGSLFANPTTTQISSFESELGLVLLCVRGIGRITRVEKRFEELFQEVQES